MTMTANAIAMRRMLNDPGVDPEQIRDLADELAGEALDAGRLLQGRSEGDELVEAIAAILGTDRDPVEAVADAAELAGETFPSAAHYLRELARAFSERDGETTGQGPFLRLERWWDTDPDGGPLTSERGHLALLDASRDPEEALADLERWGYHDASDPSQPMAALWVRLGGSESDTDITAS